MRTETLLREAMDDLAATARTPEAALPRILAGLPAPAVAARRNRRRVLLTALAVVLLVAAVTVPTVLHGQTAEPAGRVPGNWDLIHRVDLPAGWDVQQRAVSAGSESSSYRSSATAATPDAQCSVEVRAAGAKATVLKSRLVALDVNGHLGGFGTARDDQTGRVEWTYADNSFASVTCGPTDVDAKRWSGSRTQQVELDFARRVVFEPTPVRLPFTLAALPAGYEIHDVQSGQDPTAGRVSGVELSGVSRKDALPLVDISVNPGTTAPRPGIPGKETTTLDGLPAVLSATEGSLCLNDRGYTACITTGGDAVNRTSPLWPAGQRELLLEVASRLSVTKHLDDPSRWPDANAALPR